MLAEPKVKTFNVDSGNSDDQRLKCWTTLKTVFEPVSPYPALLLRRSKGRILVIADLHIGWEAGLSQQGIHIPSQTPRLIKKLEEVIRLAMPTELVILGDVKHAVAKVEPEEWRDVPEFFEKVLRLVPIVKVVTSSAFYIIITFTIFPTTGPWPI